MKDTYVFKSIKHLNARGGVPIMHVEEDPHPNKKKDIRVVSNLEE